MAQQDSGRLSNAGDAIPMQKTSVTTYLAIGVGVLAIGGVVAITTGGGDAEAEKKAAEIKAQADKPDGPQLSAKEQQEHLKMTAAAFERAKQTAAAKKAAEEQKKAAEAEAARARAAAAPGPAPAGNQAGPAPKPKAAPSKKASKKQLDSLDSIGSDIASALE